tara:strand:- start:741 stop:1205 length:465 start_codon:yes stop_codon:yes gene_type:complete
MIKLNDILEGKGLWANIHAKRKRGEKPAKPGDKDYPDSKTWKKLTKEEWVREQDMPCFIEYLKDMHACTCEGPIQEAEYQGRKVKLNKPMAGDVGKFKVYVKNPKGNVVKVNFGQKGVRIKKDNPEARASFRARHKCDQKKNKTSAGYWSCKKW